MDKNFSYPEKIFSGVLLIVVLVLFLCNSVPVLGISPRDALNVVAERAGIQTKSNLSYILGQIFKKILGVLGLILLVLFIVGGVNWMTSGGSSEKIKKARALLINAIVGLIIILLSYSLVDFIIKRMEEAFNAEQQEQQTQQQGPDPI